MEGRLLLCIALLLLAPGSSPTVNGQSPTEVRNLTAYPKYNNMLLDWLKPEPSYGIITNYTILYTVDEMEEVRHTSSNTRFIIKNLEPGTFLSDIMVFASTAVGPGPAVTLPYNVSILLRPIPVINLKVEVLPSLSVKVTWDRLDNEDITHYNVYFEWTLQGAEVGLGTVQVPATNNTLIFKNLIIGAEYTFEVQARIVKDGEIIVGPSSKNITVAIAIAAMTTTSTSSKLEGRVYTAIVLAVLAIGMTMDLHTMMLACFGAAGWMMRRCKDKYVNINLEGEPAEQPGLLLCQ